MIFDKDAFSNGQIDSKLWLCTELEQLFESIDTIWIYGGWYGITALLLRSRDRIKIKKICSFDIDPAVEKIADTINENWVFKDWQFKAFTDDCNSLKPTEQTPDLIINTSTEHFESMEWWDNIPKGKIVALQGNNMKHDDHVIHFSNLTSFVNRFPVTSILYQGQLDFAYPTWKFTRFMLIAVK